MTDSKTATERLREKLTELGKSYNTVDGKHKNTVWHVGELAWLYDEDTETGKTVLFTPKQYNVTPKQAIAATMGSDRENELQAALNKAAGNWAKADRLARDIWEQVSHCPDYPIPPCMTESICEQFRNLSDAE